VLVRGPRGAGKRVVARWLHFASAAQGGVCHVRDCASSSGDRSVARALEASAGGSLVFHGVEHLDADRQDELAQWLESEDVAASADETESGDLARAAPRVFATTVLDPAAAGQSGALRPGLAHRLDRLQIRVPALRERREDIVGMVACLAARFATAEGMQPLRLSDTATALVWRQRWEENVRELENFVYKLVLFSRGELLDADDLVAIARQFHVKLERRLPSRHPDRADLLAALRATRMPLGRWNKTRAAMYLGWDPDTLVVRMTEACITDATDATGDGTERPDTPPQSDDDADAGTDAG
jgi:DNA-binding NtrC family response regulator